MNFPDSVQSAQPVLPFEPIVYRPELRIEQGIYLQMPQEIYFATNAISVSGLKDFKVAPALYRFGKHEETIAQTIGTLWHTALLEPYELEKRFWPTDLDRRGTKAWEAEQALAGDRELIKRADWDEMQFMCASIFGQGGSLRDTLTHPELLCEVSFFWWDNGVFCRGRADIAMFKYAFVGDLKSCQDADEDFKFAVRDWLYHWQSAFYQRGLRKLGHPIEDFVFFAVEKKAPYLYRPWVMPREAVEDAERKILIHLDRYKECLAENFWPGYPAELGTVNYPESWLLYE